jgi:hypothetical protein
MKKNKNNHARIDQSSVLNAGPIRPLSIHQPIHGHCEQDHIVRKIFGSLVSCGVVDRRWQMGVL